MSKRKPKGAGSVMASRAAQDLFADDEELKLDYFPTPPWAGRAGAELVLGIDPGNWSCWEPACGAGHMVHALSDYFAEVRATDIVDRGGGYGLADFLDPAADDLPAVDWIITNPPFKDAEAFVRLGLRRARRGVAVLCRLAWVETEGRFQLFTEDHPLTAMAVFCERPAMVKGRWDPEASTATAYAWFLFSRTCAVPLHPALTWIAPGTKAALTRPSDFTRFAPHLAPPPSLFDA